MAKARTWIGVLVYKEISGKGYIGQVQGYDEGTELYKVSTFEIKTYFGILVTYKLAF